MLFYVLLLGVLTTATSQEVCPSGCSCSGPNVTCSGLSYIPKDLPRNTSQIIFQNMEITEIPAKIFMNLAVNSYIGFVNVTVGYIRSLAFFGLTNPEIAFNNALINDIGSFAISRIDTIRRLDFSSVSIGFWERHAVSHIQDLRTMAFSKTSIKKIDAPILSNIGHLVFFSLSLTDIPELPPKSFTGLNVIDLIYVYQTRIGKISTSTFWNVTYMDNVIFLQCKIDEISNKVFSDVKEIGILSFQEVHIETIRRRAFSDVDQLHNIGILDSMIDLMENYAISDLENTSSILISNSEFGIIESFAVKNVTTDIFHFTANHVDRLDCGTFEELKDTVSVDFQFDNITVNCDFNICWAFHPNRTYYLDTVFKDLQCIPQTINYPRLGAFSKTPIKDLPFGCPGFNYTAKFICNSSLNKKSYPPLILFVLTTLALMGLFN